MVTPTLVVYDKNQIKSKKKKKHQQKTHLFRSNSQSMVLRLSTVKKKRKNRRLILITFFWSSYIIKLSNRRLCWWPRRTPKWLTYTSSSSSSTSPKHFWGARVLGMCFCRGIISVAQDPPERCPGDVVSRCRMTNNPSDGVRQRIYVLCFFFTIVFDPPACYLF